MKKPPGSVANLQRRITGAAAARGSTAGRIQRTIVNTVVAQMLPPGVVKGWAAIQARVGESSSRFTKDLDAARGAELSLGDYLERLDDSLADGWGDFTGRLVELEPHLLDDVPDDYIMRPFDIRLAYRGRPWLTVPFELGRDEIGSTEHREPRLAPDIVVLFRELVLPEPQPIPVLAAEHQVVQKLHACTSVSAKTGGNERARDLVDLQILAQEENIDMAEVDDLGARLFASRHAQTWPPTVVVHAGWDTLYDDAAKSLEVLPDVDAAVDWANEFIARAVEAGRQTPAG
jgi:hypothetical protein